MRPLPSPHRKLAKTGIGEKRDFCVLCCHLDTLKGGFLRTRSGSTKNRQRTDGHKAHIDRHHALFVVIPEATNAAQHRPHSRAGRGRVDKLTHPPLRHSLIGNEGHDLRPRLFVASGRCKPLPACQTWGVVPFPNQARRETGFSRTAPESLHPDQLP